MASPRHESESKQVFEAQLRATLDVIPAYTWYADPSGALTFVNKRLADYLSLPKDHPLRFGIATGAAWDSHIALLHPDDQEESRKVWSTCVRTGCAGEFTFRVRNAEGVHRWFITRAEPLRASDGTLLYWIGVNLDIDEAKRAEDALHKSEKELRDVIDTIPAIVWSTLPDGSNTYVNKRFVEYSGSSAEQMAGSGWQALIHPDDLERHAGKWMEAVATGKPLENEVRSRRSDGQYRWQLDRGVPLRNEDGNIVKWYGVTTDIEDRKRAEEARTRNEFYLSEGQRLAHTGSWGFDPAGFYDYWSEELFRIYGLDPDKGPPTLEQYLACVHPQDRAFMAEAIQKIVDAGLGCDLKKRIVRPGGELRYIRCVGIPVIANGVLKRIIGTAMDVTEQEQLTQELQRREAYLAEAQRLSHTGSFSWRVSSGEIFWSDETFRIFQCDPSTKPTVDFVLSRVHPEDRDSVRQQIDRASRDGKGFDFEHRLRLPDSSIEHVHVTAHPSRDGAGNFEFVGAVTDISRHRQAEAMIRERESELEQILDLAPQHIGVFGPDGSPLYANRATLEYLGVGIDRWRDETARYSHVHPDDRERFLGERKRRFLEGAPHELEVRLLGHDGKFRWFLFRLNPLKDKRGQITRWYGTAIDIDDRKQAEDRLRSENVALREEIDKASMFEEIVGTSPALQTVLSRISKVAPSNSTVLITGETGTGKELVARAIHRRSPRASRPFVSVNCAAIPRDLVASELFGHEKGAFTGATQQRLGRFELASGGTLFLDEVGELPAETQIALLRVLQEHEFERVGGTRCVRADVRVIAATNRDLQAAISNGSFRSDLFYRLHVFPIEIPPLRERREDIPVLLEYFIDRYARKAGKNITTVDKKTLQLLQSYPWPGNIRELQNVIERSVIVCETANFSVDESWLSQQPRDRRAEGKLYLSRKLDEEKEIIEAALQECRGRVFGPSGAAAKLGIARSTLESKIRSLKINKNRFKAQPGI